MRMARRLSDKKLYYIFLMQKNLNKIQKTTDPLYLVTLREVTNINEIYDLEINLDMAHKIFGRKTSTKEDLKRLTLFDTNK